MGTWIRRCFGVVAAVSLGGVLAGCDGGGGGGGESAFQVWFSILGEGSCSSVTVEVDLEGTGAVLERDQSGDVDCVLDAALQHDGCSVEFSEPESGVLRAMIVGCTFPSQATLFRCGFADVDVSLLQERAYARCGCVLASCDGTPPVCIGDDPDLDLCEVGNCDNGVDDDGDGLVDCEDTSCEASHACIDFTSTTTTSNTFTTHTTEPPTSTTLPIEGCVVQFRLRDEVTVGSLQWNTDYSDAPGAFVGEGGTVECASLIEGALAAFNDHEGDESLEAGLIRVGGFTGPINVAECLFSASTPAVPADFVIRNVEAGTPDAEPILPAPSVVVVSIDCDGSAPTTTTTQEGATTTTMHGPTTSTTTTTTTTTTLPPDAYTVLLKLETASAALGALQVAVHYDDAPGGFLGSGSGAACTTDIPEAVFAKNDNDASRRLVFGIVSLATFSAPIDLVSCEFRGSAVPTAKDFELVIEEAADGTLESATVTISLVVTAAP